MSIIAKKKKCHRIIRITMMQSISMIHVIRILFISCCRDDRKCNASPVVSMTRWSLHTKCVLALPMNSLLYRHPSVYLGVYVYLSSYLSFYHELARHYVSDDEKHGHLSPATAEHCAGVLTNFESLCPSVPLFSLSRARANVRKRNMHVCLSFSINADT